jgi:hypothetical protein
VNLAGPFANYGPFSDGNFLIQIPREVDPHDGASNLAVPSFSSNSLLMANLIDELLSSAQYLQGYPMRKP